ncbi:MAG: DUF4142 domain-containing protein [Cyanobacteriota bacterium]
MIKKLTITTALLTVGLITSLGYTSVAQTNRPSTQQNPTNRPATQPNLRRLSIFDQQFMRRAAQGNMAEIELSQLALQQGDSDEVKQYAQRMIQEHTQANATLSQLAQQKGVNLPRELDPQHQAIRAQLEQLSGERFDQEYMRVMENDHVLTVTLFRNGTRQAQDQDVRRFASTTLPRLQGHLQMVRAMMGNNSAQNSNTRQR